MAKIAIIGAGLTGLTSAWKLSQAGFEVSIFEEKSYPGGLAAGFKEKEWSWYLDHHYHHVFASDTKIKEFLKELKLEEKLFFKRPKTSIYYQNQTFQLDSPTSLLKAPALSIFSKLRVGLTLALKIDARVTWFAFREANGEKLFNQDHGR